MKIGIDFGTTTSNIFRLLPDGRLQSAGPIPSIAAWRNDQYFFGSDADELLASDDAKVYPLRDLKLKLDRGLLRVGSQQLDPVDAVSRFLTFLASKVTGGQKVTEAILGTPVSASKEHRDALLKAAERAGFDNVRLVYEPTSALLGATNIDALDANSQVLVIDWGGGTLDLSVVRRIENVLRELEVDGDIEDLGGTQIDKALADKILERQPHIRTKLDSVPLGFQRFKQEVEAKKIEILLEGASGENNVFRINPPWLREIAELRPSDVRAVLTDHANRALDQISRLLHSASIAKGDITHLLFAGGVCSSQIVQTVISAAFPEAKRIPTSNPQLLTGAGCAQLAKRGFELQLSSPFGVRECDDAFCTLLPAGHPVAADRYRQLEFMLVDVRAPEAVFELGIRKESQNRGMISGPLNGFRSMRQAYVQAQNGHDQAKGETEDCIRVFCGIDRTMSVQFFAESNLTGKSTKETVSGVPMDIVLGKAAR